MTAQEPATRFRRGLAIAGAVALVVLVYLTWGRPSPRFATVTSNLTQLALAVVAAATCLAAARRSAGAERMFWGNLAAFAAVWSLGQLSWTLAAGASVPEGILQPWDILFLFSVVPAVTAILCRPDRWAGVRSGLFLDAALLAVAAFHVYVFFAVGHWLAGDEGGYAQWLDRIHVAKAVLAVSAAAWATATAGRARFLYARLTAAFVLLHFGGAVSNAVMRVGAYRPGLYDLPWTLPFLWIAWLAASARFPGPPSRARPSNDWRESRLGAVVAVVLVLLAPTVHLGFVLVHGATAENTRLRVPLTLATTVVVAFLAIARHLGHLRRVQLRIAAREQERDAAERSRRHLEDRYRGLVQSISAVVWRADPATFRVTFVSDRAEELLGYPVSAWTEQPDFWVSRLHPEDREAVEKLCREAIAEGRTDQFRYRMVSASGDTVWVSDSLRVIATPEGGTEVVGVMMDITEHKRLEDGLRQAQKMEAVGLLAGGIAHDFNNLLGVIGGYAELAQRSLAPGHPAYGRVQEVRVAADRAADLTRQLLAFSRRQIVQRKLLDLGELVRGLQPMLQRILGEDIQLVTRLEAEGAIVNADPGQIEQVVMNLAINARDAMPRGGPLVIRAGRTVLDEAFVRAHHGARPGAHVVLEVSDEGMGMDAATIARVFEPFFTTKEKGRGTGLGLATVYGIVKQSDGYVSVDSTPGVGSTFRVFLPLAEGAPASAGTAAAEGPAGGTETILVLEDEDGLRSITREILEGAGYRVLDARDVVEGVTLASEAKVPIHAILSDVVMPGGTGPEGVALIRALYPEIRVLYMSGYPDLDERQAGPGALEIIEKPFNSESLLRRMRALLDA